jgi:hypothetical protein
VAVVLGAPSALAQLPAPSEPAPDEAPALADDAPTAEPSAPEPAEPSAARVRWTEPAPALPQAPPEPPPQPAKNLKRWHLSLALTHERFTSDDFDDSQVLVQQVPDHTTTLVAVPELRAGTGFALGLGYGIYPEEVGAVGFWSGLSYSVKWLSLSSEHTPSAPEGVLHDLDIPLRIGYRATRRLLPYAQISYGFSFLSMTGVHGYRDEEGSVVFDNESALFMGRAFDFGIGSLFPLNETFSIDVFVGYGIAFATSVDDQELEDSLNAGVLTLSFGPTLFF